MIRAILALAALGAIALGMWLIAAGFTAAEPPAGPPQQTISGPPQTASPIILGTALLAGGVGFLVLVCRRR